MGLIKSDSEVTGSTLGYTNAFELVAPLRDYMMYDPKSLRDSADLWKKYTQAFTDCSVKLSDTQGDHGTAYGTDAVYEYLKNPNGKDIHHYVLQYLEEGAIDLVCVMI